MAVAMNCDMGESYGLYKMGEDEEMMPLISRWRTLLAGSTALIPITCAATIKAGQDKRRALSAHILHCLTCKDSDGGK